MNDPLRFASRSRTPAPRALLRRPTRGFTLVEILIVTGILAVLAALLFVAGDHAFAAARRTQCLSNMKNVLMAWKQWGRDHPVSSPAGESAPQALRAVTADGETWADVLLPDLDEGVLHCPSRPDDDLADPARRGYGVNPLCGGQWWYPSGMLGAGFLLTPQDRRQPLLDLVARPSLTVVLVDAGYVTDTTKDGPPVDWAEDAAAPWAPYAAFPLTGPVITGSPGHVAPGHGYDWGNTLPGSGIGTMGWDAHYRALARHGGGVSGFVDGHIRSIPVDELLGPAWGEPDCLYDNQPE